MRLDPRAVAACFALALAYCGCSWVPLDTGAADIRVTSPAAAADCEQLGEARTRTADRVWLFGRRASVVDEEHTNLARNEAARMGGDSVALLETPNDAERLFGVYRCGAR